MNDPAYSQFFFLWLSVMIYACLALLGSHWSILSTVVNTLSVTSLYSIVGKSQGETHLGFQLAWMSSGLAICIALVISSAQIIMAYTILAETLVVMRALENWQFAGLSWMMAMMYPQLAVVSAMMVTYEHVSTCKGWPSLAEVGVSKPRIFESLSDFYTATLSFG